MSDGLNGRVCLATGASSGIGWALVERLRARNAVVHAVARDAARLRILSEKTGCVSHAIDATDVAAMAALASDIAPDIIICNAGMNSGGSLIDADPDRLDAIVDLNLTSVLHLLRAALPALVARDRGHIVLLGSISGAHALTGGNAIYHATKAAIRALADQLRVDLTGHRIRVTEIAPGRTRTAIFARSLGDETAARERFLDGHEPLEPGDVADAIIYALSAPNHVNISHIEITPTLQVIGGLTTVASKDATGARKAGAVS